MDWGFSIRKQIGFEIHFFFFLLTFKIFHGDSWKYWLLEMKEGVPSIILTCYNYCIQFWTNGAARLFKLRSEKIICLNRNGGGAELKCGIRQQFRIYCYCSVQEQFSLVFLLRGNNHFGQANFDHKIFNQHIFNIAWVLENWVRPLPEFSNW